MSPVKGAGHPFLLIDADVFAYKAAAGAERVITFDNEWYFPACSILDAEDAFLSMLLPILEEFDVDMEKDCAFCFSTDRNGGFRRGVLPSYKTNRDGKARPVALKFLREKLMSGRSVIPAHSVYLRPGLEADDCLGILSTQKSYQKGRQKIIVSIDKDMKSLPGYFYNIGHPEEGVLFVSEEEADHWFMKQTLMGDTTDGYGGCPGVGPKGADKVLADCKSLSEMWAAVVKAYDKAGLSEEYAIQQARVARILRAEDYDFHNKQVKLWRPPSDDCNER